MASFRGTVRLESDPDTTVRALVDVGSTGLTLLAGNDELGSWARSDVKVHEFGDGFMLVADREKLVLDLEEGSAFAAAVGLDPSPTRTRQRRPTTEAAPAPTRATSRRRFFGRRRAAEDASPAVATNGDNARASDPHPTPSVATADAPESTEPVPEPASAITAEPQPATGAVDAAPQHAADHDAQEAEAEIPEAEVPEAEVPEAEAGPPDREATSGNATTGVSAEFQTLRDRSTVHYTEDEVLKRPVGFALAGAGLALLIGSALTWGAARLTNGSFAVGRVLAGIGAIFAVTGAYIGVYNEQRRAGAWGAVGGGAVALVILVFAAREARVGWGFILSFIATIAVVTLGVVALLDWSAAPPQRRSNED